jgi:drug/metabolite transporter (DMT)-like permease
VATILWSFLLFRTLPGLQQLIGGLAVMVGVLVVTWQQRR